MSICLILFNGGYTSNGMPEKAIDLFFKIEKNRYEAQSVDKNTHNHTAVAIHNSEYLQLLVEELRSTNESVNVYDYSQLIMVHRYGRSPPHSMVANLQSSCRY